MVVKYCLSLARCFENHVFWTITLWLLMSEIGQEILSYFHFDATLKKYWQQWYIGQHKQPIWGPKTNNIEPNWGFMTTDILLSSYMIMMVHNSDDIIIGFAFKLTITTIDIGHFNCQSNCQRNCQLSEQCLCSWKEWHNFWLENLQLFWDLRLIVWRSAYSFASIFHAFIIRWCSIGVTPQK